MRALDWSATPLGPVAGWPQSLRTALSMILEAQFPMAVAWGPELRVFYNDRCAPIFGSKHPGALGMPAAASFPEIWDLIAPGLETAQRGDAFSHEDWQLPRVHDGYLERCWFTVSYSPIRDESGGVGGVLAVIAETTARVEGERRHAMLRELAADAAHARTTEAVGASAAAALARNPLDVPFAVLYELDADGRTARRLGHAGLPEGHAAAPAAIALAAPAAAAGAPAADPAPVDGWPIARVVRAGVAEVIEAPAALGPLPGGPYPEPARAAILLPLARPGLARPYGVLVAGISPRRALDDRYRGFFELAAEHIATAIGNACALEELQRALSLVDATLATVPVGLAFYDRDLRFVRVNETLARWNGWDPDHLIGRTLAEIASPVAYNWLAPKLLSVLASGQISEPIERSAPNLAEPGELRHWLMTCYPVRDTLVGVVTVDVTDEVRARDRLARTILYNEKFTAILGHDLRNPLNAIMTTAQLLQRRASSDEIARPAARIVASGDRMLRMINQLLDLARVRVTGGLAIAPRTIDLAEVCRAVVDELRVAYPDAPLELTAEGALGGRWVAARLAQVVSCRAANARGHGVPGAPVRIQLDGHTPGRVRIRVENQGAIPDAILPLLFDPFRSADYRNAKARGLGLGLYLSREIVAAHGGKLTVHSTATDGTRFEIELPRLGELMA